MSDERKTGGGANVEGDADTGGGAFTGRDHIEQNFYLDRQPSKPPEPEPRPRRLARKPGKLMPDEAAELRQSIDRLTEKMSQSNIAVTELRGTVNRNNDLTVRSISAFEEQLTIFKAQIMTRAPVWVAYLTVTFLALIAVVLTVVSVVWILQR